MNEIIEIKNQTIQISRRAVRIGGVKFNPLEPRAPWIVMIACGLVPSGIINGHPFKSQGGYTLDLAVSQEAMKQHLRDDYDQVVFAVSNGSFRPSGDLAIACINAALEVLVAGN